MSTRKDHLVLVDTIHGKHFFSKQLPLNVSKNGLKMEQNALKELKNELKEKLLNMLLSSNREEERRVSNKNITIENLRGNRDSTIVGGKDPQRSLFTYYGTIFRSITSITMEVCFRLLNITLQSLIRRH